MNNIGLENLVGLSGGVDSMVLLHQLVVLRENNPDIKLRVIHINHQLSPNAESWAAHCQSVCEEFNVSFEVVKVDATPKNGESPEEAARRARYSALSEKISEKEYLLTAHNADDQAETVMLQLLRGAGPKGLAAMPEITTFYKGFHSRPLLHLTREEILNYARKNNLTWIDDESNQNNNFDRNYLRNTVMPLLKSRWPQLTKSMSRSAKNCSEAKNMLAELAENDLKFCENAEGNILITSLNKLNYQRKKNLLRYYLHEKFSESINAKKLEELVTTFLISEEDKNPIIELEKYDIRRFKDRLFVTRKLPSLDAKLIIPWDLNQPLKLPVDMGILNPQDFEINENENVTVRFRQGGEKCKPEGRKETHTLKKLFQDWGVPPWVRDRVPLLYVGNELAYVVGYCKCVRE